jgi:hypothetical protein
MICSLLLHHSLDPEQTRTCLSLTLLDKKPPYYLAFYGVELRQPT